MELAEPIERINKQLIDLFGVDTITGDAMFRVVFSNDQREKRLSNTTREGLVLLYPEVMELPKYQWIRDLYILERLVLVPVVNMNDLPTSAFSYECIWVFKGAAEEYLPPKIQVCKFVIDTLYAALGKKSMAKYVDEEAKNPVEERNKRIDKLQEELFGDESFLLGRTITGEAVGYTGKPKI